MYSYHPPSVFNYLPKYYKGEIDKYPLLPMQTLSPLSFLFPLSPVPPLARLRPLLPPSLHLSASDMTVAYDTCAPRSYENYYTFESKFYNTMKTRVAAYMKQHHLSRSAWPMYAKTAVLLALWALAYYVAILQGHILAAVILGFFHAQLGINIMHDGNHGAYPIHCLSMMALCLLIFLTTSADTAAIKPYVL